MGVRDMDDLGLRSVLTGRGTLIFDKLWLWGDWLWAGSAAQSAVQAITVGTGGGLSARAITWMGGGETPVIPMDTASLVRDSETVLFLSDGVTGGVRVQSVADNGALGLQGPLTDPQGRALALGELALLQTDDALYLAATPASRDGLRLYRLDEALEHATLLSGPVDTVKSTLSGVSQLLTLRIGDTDFVIASSSAEDGLSTYALTGTRLELRDTLGPKDGLWIDGLEDITALTVGGQTFVLGISAQSGTLSVVRVNPVGALFVTDIALDDLSTRFNGAVALDTFDVAGRGFIVTGGTDDGVALFELLPGGTLLHHQSIAQDLSWDIGHIRDIDATVTGEAAQILVTGADGGALAQLELPLSDLGLLTRGTGSTDQIDGTPGHDVLMGLWGDDTLSGGAGDDTLIAGPGADALYGGPGADVFVLTADGQRDHIYGFELGVDRIDLDGWGMIYDIETLTIRGRTFGAGISWRDEFVYIHTPEETRIEPGEWSTDDFLF